MHIDRLNLIACSDIVQRDDDLVLFNRANGCVVHLNQMGYAAFLHFVEGCSVKAAIKSLSSIYGVDVRDIADETMVLVQLLISKGILLEIES